MTQEQLDIMAQKYAKYILDGNVNIPDEETWNDTFIREFKQAVDFLSKSYDVVEKGKSKPQFSMTESTLWILFMVLAALFLITAFVVSL